MLPVSIYPDEISFPKFPVPLQKEIEGYIKNFTCPVSFELLDQAVVFIPCLHRVQQAIANRMFEGKKMFEGHAMKNECPICKAEVKSYSIDHSFREICKGLIPLFEKIHSSIDKKTEDLSKIAVLRPELSKSERPADMMRRALLADEALIIIKCDIPFGHKIEIRGSGAGLDWDKGQELKKIDSKTYVYPFKKLTGDVSFKIVYDKSQWETCENHTIRPGQKLEIIPSLEISSCVPLIVNLDQPKLHELIKSACMRRTGREGSWDKNSDGSFKPAEIKILRLDGKEDLEDPVKIPFGTALKAVDGKYILEVKRGHFKSFDFILGVSVVINSGHHIHTGSFYSKEHSLISGENIEIQPELRTKT